MPDANGKLQLQDYDAALVARGFDGFQPVERYQMINAGYRYLARKFPWSWEETSQQFTVAPPAYQINAGGGVPLTIDQIRGVDLVSDPYRGPLTPETEIQFITKWRSLDLTNAANRGVPFRYQVYDNQIWLLPAPQVSMNFMVYFRQYLADLVNTTDTPVTPQILDEVLLDAALVRAHRRAHELQLAQEAQVRVDEAIDDMLSDDAFRNEEIMDRVLPDNQWL